MCRPGGSFYALRSRAIEAKTNRRVPIEHVASGCAISRPIVDRRAGRVNRLKGENMPRYASNRFRRGFLSVRKLLDANFTRRTRNRAQALGWSWSSCSYVGRIRPRGGPHHLGRICPWYFRVLTPKRLRSN